MTVRVVLPAYNEAESLKSLLPALIKSFKDEGKKFHIYVVDDGSSDDTASVIRHSESGSAGQRISMIRHRQNMGLSEAVNSGLRRALKDSGDDDIIVTMDADNSHLPGLISRMARLIKEGYDVVISSRFTGGARVRGVPLSRRILSRGASILFRLLFPIQGVKDYTCGYRAYRVSLLKKAISKYGSDFINQKGFSCMVDILLKLREFDPIVTEVPMILRYDLKPGKSKMDVTKTIFETLALVGKYGRSWLPFISVLLISAFFRFYKFSEFQYWGGDEEVMTATLRHIVWDRSPTLLVQSASLGFGLGPFYHYFLAIFYAIFHFNLVLLQSIGSVLGVATTVLIYLSGKELGGKKLGFLAGFLYAGSFFFGFNDRRVVHLSLNPLMAALTCLVLIKVIKRQYRFLPLLAVPAGFAFHEDASLLVLVVGIILSFIILKIPVRCRETLTAAGIFLIFILPFAAAEVKYNGAVAKPFIKSVMRPFTGETRPPPDWRIFRPPEYFHVLARGLLAKPSKMAEEYFAYSLSFPNAYLSPVPEFAIFSILIFGLIKSVKRKEITCLWILNAAFILGLAVFNVVFKENFYAHYFMVLFPVYVLLLAYSLMLVFRRAIGILVLLMVAYLVINVGTLLVSEVKYPLYRKIELVKKTLPALGGKDFSLDTSGNPYIQGGGWTELYTLTGHPAAKSYWYDFWGWIYAAYSLFPPGIKSEQPEMTVFVRKQKEAVPERIRGEMVSSFGYKDLIIDVYKNP